MPITLNRIAELHAACADYAQALDRVFETIGAYASLESENSTLAQLASLRLESLLREPIQSARTFERETQRLKSSRSESQRRQKKSLRGIL